MANLALQERQALTEDEFDWSRSTRKPQIGKLGDAALHDLVGKLGRAREAIRDDATQGDRRHYLEAALRRVRAELQRRAAASEGAEPDAAATEEGSAPPAAPEAAPAEGASAAVLPAAPRVAAAKRQPAARLPRKTAADRRGSGPRKPAAIRTAAPPGTNGVAAPAEPTDETEADEVLTGAKLVQYLTEKAERRAEKVIRAHDKRERLIAAAIEFGGKKALKKARKAEEKLRRAERKARKTARQARRAAAALDD
ncbi:hypothetical protein [Paracoccus jeotgali]|uniref:Uncharacterized protein n=1 Tax=Paracoccus jeotgali TaxID=2065379 RepID=A0A2K9MID9_9RHOB|nr:hypothetical protein [Paracoccus jeotgali]AUM74305.1 hypothetical protein CYR75_08505 [Paracoccus jeotgali]